MKIIRNPILLLFTASFILIGCSTGGILVPIAQEGAELISTMVKDDTLRVTQNLITVQAHGSWGDLNSETFIEARVSNNSDRTITLDFKRCKLTDSNNDEGDLMTASEQLGKEFRRVPNKSAVINPKEEKMYYLSFAFLPKGGEPDKIEKPFIGKTVVLIIPVFRDPGKVAGDDFTFKFKYEHRRMSSILDLLAKKKLTH